MRRESVIAGVVLVALGVAGCGGDDDDDGQADQVDVEQPENADTDDHQGHEPSDDPADDGADVDGDDDGDDEPDDDGDIVQTITVEAGDLYFEGIPETLPAGTIEIEFENVGEMPHDITIEELDDLMVVVAEGGESDVGTVTLEPGEYTFYCAVPGHRPQMEVTVTVE